MSEDGDPFDHYRTLRAQFDAAVARELAELDRADAREAADRWWFGVRLLVAVVLGQFLFWALIAFLLR